jgi:hypothetical protein
MTAEDFVKAELEKSGKTAYTLEEVERLVVEYREKKAAAAAFEGWKDATVDELLGIEGVPV